MKKILDILRANSKVGDKIILKVKDLEYSFRCTIESFDEDYLIVSTKNQPLVAVKGENIENVRKTKDFTESAVKAPTRPKSRVDKIAAPSEKNNSKPNPATKQSQNIEQNPKKKIALNTIKENKKVETTTTDIPNSDVGQTKVPLPAMGHIIAVDGAYITIKPLKVNQFVTSKEHVIDKGLMKEINQKVIQKDNNYNIPVLWSVLDEEIICVIGQLSPEQIASRINTFRDGDNLKAALSLALLLNQYSQYPLYVKRLSQIQALYKGGNIGQPSDSSMTSYEKGMKLLQNGNYDEAINCFKQSLIQKEKIVLSIKGLVAAYTSSEQTNEAVKLIKDYCLMDFHEPFKLNAINFGWLRGWLYQQGLWSDCISVIDKKLSIQSEDLNNKQKATLYSQKASCYLKMENDIDSKKAEELLRQALEMDPDNRDARISLQEITGEFLTTSAAVDSLRNSTFTNSILTIKDNEIFLESQPSKGLADKLEAEYRLLNYQSFEERAKILLQRAKVEHRLNSGKQEENKLISLYLTAFAQGGYKKNILTKDSLRFLLCESISVWGADLPSAAVTKVLDCMSIFFNTFNPNPELVFKSMQKMVNILDSRDLFKDPSFYDQVSSLMQYRYPFSRLASYFYDTQYQVSASEYLRCKGCNIPLEATKEEFIAAWNELILRKRKMIDQLGNMFKLAEKSVGFDELKERFTQFYSQRKEYLEILSELDYQRVDEVSELLNTSLVSYFHSDEPNAKILPYKDSLAGIEKLTTNYTLAPTRFSYDSLVSILAFCRQLIIGDFERLTTTTQPQLTIDTIGDCTIDDDDDIVTFQLVISNKQGGMPARNFAIKILPSDEILMHLKGFATNYNSILGGTQQIVQQTIKLAPCITEKGAVDIEVLLTYQSVEYDKPKELPARLSLQFVREKVRIPNPYGSYTGEPITPQDSNAVNLFKGREQYINNTADDIMNTDRPKQIIIYGQRRSGKTSVLNFLKAELQKRGAFCVEFSLEGLGKDIRVTGRSDIFFAFVMVRIAEAVRKMSNSEEPLKFKYVQGEYVTNPEKIYPEYCESYEVTQKFIRDIAELHEAFNACPRWMGRKIVLLMDEFTHVYTMIKSGHLPDTIMKQWKAATQNEFVRFSVVMIGQDTTPQFIAEPYAENAFGVIDADRLDYLPQEGARELIVDPLRDKEGKSRFLNNAVERVMELTACSPYFLMNFCARLVDYMNKNQKGKVTEVDVDNALQFYLEDPTKKMDERLFHSLFSAVDVEEEERQKTKTVLRVIAEGMDSKDPAALTTDWIIKKVGADLTADEVKQILADLDIRQVAPYKDNKHRIKVIMFQKWLLEN